MKKIFVAFMFGLLSMTAFAEATFDEIQGLINSKNYAAAEAGLEVIIKNHPNSAKAFYAMAEAQAGLGNLEKANKALNLAKGIDPTLKFVSEGSVRNLEQAITPQTAKITYEEPSHWFRNFVIFALFCGFGWACYFFWCVYNRQKAEEEIENAKRERETRADMDRRAAESKRKWQEQIAEQEAKRKESEAKEAALKAHKNYGHERFDPSNPDKLKSVKQMKEEKAAQELREAQARAEAAEASARMYRTSAQAVQPTHTTVVNNSNDGFVTGMLVGNMLSGSHHDHTTIIERDVVRETPSRDSSWDDTPARSSSSRSSSWDDDSSSSKSSSWDDSSSSRSSSWDSDSSSSSSSWDSSSSDSSSSDW